MRRPDEPSSGAHCQQISCARLSACLMSRAGFIAARGLTGRASSQALSTWGISITARGTRSLCRPCTTSFSKASDIVVGTQSAITGPAEEFVQPQGFDSAKVGETFVKIGVGVLRKADDSPVQLLPRL